LLQVWAQEQAVCSPIQQEGVQFASKVQQAQLYFEKDCRLHDACELRALSQLQKALKKLVGSIVSSQYDESVADTQTQQQTYDEQNNSNLGGNTQRHLLY
jgi:putative IMPACT (imprinted ancient) family translation regulator